MALKYDTNHFHPKAEEYPHMYLRLRDMILPSGSPMEQRMVAHGISGRMPNTQVAYDAVHRLVALRRATGLHRLLDPLREIEDSLWVRPSEKIEGRRCQVRDAKAVCLKAGVPAQVVDDIFPEPPLMDIMPHASRWARLRDDLGYRFALWRERQNNAGHMEGAY